MEITENNLESPEMLSPAAPENRYQQLTFAKYFERELLWSEIEKRSPTYCNTALKIFLTIPLIAIQKSTWAIQELGNAGISFANRQISEFKPTTTNTRSQEELDAAFVSAVEYGNLKEIEELIQAGANPQSLIPYQWTMGDCDWDFESPAITYAIRKNYPDIVKILLKSEKNPNEFLPMAINERRLKIVKEFINAGVNLNYVDGNKNTPLLIAIDACIPSWEFSRDPKYSDRWYYMNRIIQTLLEAGANTTQANKNGTTALMMAVKKHDLHTVEALLKLPETTTGGFFGLGIKPINCADNDGNTALILAFKAVATSYIAGDNQQYYACVNSQKIIQMLLDIPGIDVYHANKNGETAIKLLEDYNRKANRYPYY